MDELKDIHMIEQPLLTEEGFINQAAINELEMAIKNMPPPHKRNSDDSEWTKKRWTFLHEITAGLAHWAIRQSPYACPDDLEAVVKFLEACLRREFLKLNHRKDATGIMAEVSLCMISEWLHSILMSLPQVTAWNTAKDGDTREIRYTSREGSDATGPDNDFIDIGALFNNVCIGIRDERRKNDEFDRKFEEEQEKRNAADNL